MVTGSQLAQLTFYDIVAQDMVLDDAFQCMPPVIIAEEVVAAHGSVRDGSDQMLTSLRLKPQCLAPLELHLEWYAPSFMGCSMTSARASISNPLALSQCRSMIDARAVGPPGGADAALLMREGLRPDMCSQPPASTSPTQTLHLLIGAPSEMTTGFLKSYMHV